jgi:hypothetical protein
LPKFSEEEESNLQDDAQEVSDEVADVEDTDPPLDEEDLEENNLTVEEADQIIWDAPKKGSSSSEEKDITD